MTEHWLPVVGYEGMYEVSDLGRVKSVERRVRGPHPGGRVVRERILAPQNVAGYLAVTLRDGRVAKCSYIHSMVLEAFIGPRPSGPGRIETLHGDGDPRRNVLGNLRWGTCKENAADMRRHGTWRPLPSMQRAA